MPAAYTHITLVNLLREPQRLQQIPGFPRDAIPAVLDYFKYCELGAVSPDYPYLAIGDNGAARWADLMHYEQTVEKIRVGVRHLRELHGEAQRKCLAWLLGYAAHVATDVAIHPVVFLKVGPYGENKNAHRICEMQQDAYIFQRLNLGGLGLSEHLRSGIWACHDREDSGRLDREVDALWQTMLQEAHPAEYGTNPPDPSTWRKRFKLVVDDIAEEGNKLLPFARHVAAGLGLVYPAESEVAPEFIRGLHVPTGFQDYDQVFDAAVRDVGTVWRWIASAALGADSPQLAQAGNWDLDTGRDQRGHLVFWG
jgi:hypothetical protein